MSGPMPHAPRLDNGLVADTYAEIADVDPAAADRLLSALARARIAAYVDPVAESDWPRLYVGSEDRTDARSVVAAVVRGTAAGSGGAPVVRPIGDGLSMQSVEDRFARLVGDWHVDTVTAIRSAERDLTSEDADWRARLTPPPTPEEGTDAERRAAPPAVPDEPVFPEEHYVPPAPPPLPRLSGATVMALLILIAGIAVMAAGQWIGLGGDIGFLLGVAGILISAGMLVMRLRSHPGDEDDDGAIL